MRQQILENERLMSEANMTWEEKLRKSQRDMDVAAQMAEARVRCVCSILVFGFVFVFVFVLYLIFCFVLCCFVLCCCVLLCHDVILISISIYDMLFCLKPSIYIRLEMRIFFFCGVCSRLSVNTC